MGQTNDVAQNTAYNDATYTTEETSSFDWRKIFEIFILNWQWFVVSLCVCLCVAFVYLRYTSSVYKVSVKMLVKEDNNSRSYRSRSMLSNMQALGSMSSASGLENEMEIIKSKRIAEAAVRSLKLYTEYKREGRIKDRIVYKTQAVNVDLDPKSLDEMNESNLPITLEIAKEGKTYKVKGKAYRMVRVDEGSEAEEEPFEATISHLPATVQTAAGTLTLTRNVGRYVRPITEDRCLKVSILPPSLVALHYASSMEVEALNKETNIALISINDYDSERAGDYLVQLIKSYNEEANADKNTVAMKTEEFINGRLEKINAELGETESNIERYKRSQDLTQLPADLAETVSQTSKLTSQLAETKSQIQLLDYLREYVNDPKNKYQIIPSNVGLQDPSSTSLITSYNKAVLDRNRLLRSASELSPQVQTLTTTLNELQTSIKAALMQARRTADIQRQTVEGQYNIYRNKVSNTPTQERILTQIGRLQEVKSALYSMLLQKREENSISLASTADNGKMIDTPAYEGKVKPKGQITYLVALLLGISLPMLVFFVKQLMHTKIEGHEDLAQLTKLPIIADVAVASEKAKSTADIVVHENTNDQIDEIFRSLRTNVQFELKEGQNVILLTSSISGEGKTFLAANLATSFALLGKRVILIGLDIRKPALGKLFGLKDTKMGVTPLLIKAVLTKETVASQVQPSGVNKNLDLMLAGPIPPNPTELLARNNLKTLVDMLRQDYDYVLLDTAPVGILSDTLQISKCADMTVYVCCADYTPKSMFVNVNKLSEEKKMPNICVVLNGVDMSKKKNSYTYGYGRYGKYGRYGQYGKYGSYSKYGSYGSYGNYTSSHYGNADDESIKR